VAVKKQFELRDPVSGETEDIDVSDIPEGVIYPLRAYLGGLPAYDMSLDWNKQKTEEPSKQHGFAVFYFTRTFELLGVSLGHIFKVLQSEVDMRDVVLNRRILVVNLPALESSDDRLAAFGQDRGRLAARHDGADAGLPARGRLRVDRRQQAGHGRRAVPRRPR
jgi:intracellular multiplication protein IcmO